MSRHLKYIIIAQLLIALTFTIMHLIYERILFKDDEMIYLETKKGDNMFNLQYYLFIFFSWVLALSNIVPISLLVTIEMIKFCQAILISWDFKIYDVSNARPTIVQSSGLNEELGQVKV